MRTQTVCFGYTLERGEDEVDVDVECAYWPGCPATMTDPEDFGDIEILSVKDSTGKEVEITNEEAEKIAYIGWEEAQSSEKW